MAQSFPVPCPLPHPQILNLSAPFLECHEIGLNCPLVNQHLLPTPKRVFPEEPDCSIFWINFAEPPIHDGEQVVKRIEGLGPMVAWTHAVPVRPDGEMKPAISVQLGMLKRELDAVVRQLAEPMMMGEPAVPAALDARHALDDATRRLD